MDQLTGPFWKIQYVEEVDEICISLSVEEKNGTAQVVIISTKVLIFIVLYLFLDNRPSVLNELWQPS